MQESEHTNESQSSPALYSGRQVSFAAFFGGALGGGWLMAANFGALQHLSQKRFALLASVLLTVFVVFAAMWLPTDFPNALLPMMILGVFAVWFRFKQQPAFASHKSVGGPQVSWWKAIGISVASFLASVVMLVLIMLAFPVLPINHVQDGTNLIFYEGDATRQDAEELASFFRVTGVFNEFASWEMTLRFPRQETSRAVISMPYAGTIEGTAAHEELTVLATLLDQEMYRVRDTEIHVQNALGVTTLVVSSD